MVFGDVAKREDEIRNAIYMSTIVRFAHKLQANERLVIDSYMYICVENDRGNEKRGRETQRKAKSYKSAHLNVFY